ncbi:type VII secretion-associated serine protease mycosin [Streptomyces sp. DG2A-72]|uniref:type VII secretion-associated serine protease mycosin n=1 Tax=Streptomyces sp. DG2A-72 TaxID=3051386 RepID=UPI00265C2E82|nr:type VII secretion-associated serine protease mycosin [Streptomyces sp. DG2A-72]MDO0937016.1 type VII secretion-associated serine protease mycosin [Streptomyces sp. DG2A-72]
MARLHERLASQSYLSEEQEVGFKRVWSAAGVVALTGALLLTAAPVASADYVRDQQWVLDVFAMEDTWAETQGEGVTVAVVDSGVDGSHPDLTGQVLEGKDFTGGGNAQKDVDGHGTSMASLIAAHGHGAGNASGMVGFAPKAKILPLRVIQTQKDPNHDETWAAAVRYAVDHGAKVINLSFGNDGGKTLSDGRAAIAYAQAHDVVVVASAGNEGSIAVDEPAALPGVVSVGAVDEEGNRWDGSNTGKGLTLMAPGAQILAADTTRSQQYSMSTGTSDATAYVSATAALVRSKFPDLTAGQVINRLIKSASFLGHKGLKAPDEEYGYGIIRPRQAVTMDIPAGPKENPLGQLQSASSTSGKASEGTGTSTQAKKKKSSSSNILVLAGGIAAVVVIGAIVFAVIRSRRNGGNGGPGSGGGTPAYGSGYPTQPPMGHQPYPNAAPNQGYPTAPGQSPQHPNPYAQQPPHQGQ